MALFFLNKESQAIFDNPEKFLYRVMPLDRIMEILEKNRWPFVSPTLWNDPFEKAFIEAEYKHNGTNFCLPIKPNKVSGDIHYTLFSACFTETSESEAFWKTYSPNGDGIRLKVNASQFRDSLSQIKNFDIYIGKASYEDYKSLYKFQEDETFWKDLQSKNTNETHLKLLLKKRLPFKYENEVRILLLRKKPMLKSVAKVTLPKTISLIQGIKLDPRMGTYMAKMVKESFINKGFQPEVIRKSRLYSKPNSTITFKTDIDLPSSDIKIYELW
ncbi:MAG TPA: DUF2971 domain-containing protein [Chitinophagales bacterium]|nr:DUF2971 domain-containing protein [Chitinophagales bacterium]